MQPSGMQVGEDVLRPTSSMCHQELQTFDLQCIHEVATHFTALKNAGSEMYFTRLFVVASTTAYIYSHSYMTRVITSKDCGCEERRRKRREQGKKERAGKKKEGQEKDYTPNSLSI
jgi:hypothetical protein